MAKDFVTTRRTSRPKPLRKTPRKARNRKKPRKKTSAPLWAWTIIGLLLVMLIVLLLYVVNNRPGKRALSIDSPGKHTDTGKTPQPRFDFYEILKQQNIEVPDRSGEITAGLPKDLRYFLQAGSFRNSQDADRLRAQLLLLNLETKIEPAISQGETWYRVIVGPFQSRSKMASARSILVSNDLSPLLLKRHSDN